jgi:hypothetical protein
MNKKKEININMPQPCNKREWDDMTPNTQGRHCDNCNFTVIDFTNFTDRELVDFLIKSNGKICGMFENHQLNRSMAISPTKNNTLLNRALLSTALFAGIATGINGQINTPAQSTVQNKINPDKPQKKNTDTKLQIIKGVITVKKSKVPPEEVTIGLKESDIEVNSDTDGTFSLTLPDSLFGKKITLEVDLSGYKSQEVIVDTSVLLTDLAITLVPYKRKFNPFRKKRVYRTMGCPSF